MEENKKIEREVGWPWSIYTNKPPLIEGKCPPVYDKDKKQWFYPEPVEYVDPEIRETETYSVEDKEEFYDYVTKCKTCGTQFIAYNNDWKTINYFCPGCGKQLEKEAENGPPERLVF